MKKRYSNKTDLWSIGVIFYEMLTGKPIFYDEVKTKEELIAKVTGSDIQYPSYISQVRTVLYVNTLNGPV